jgi:hypothetical protein
MAWQEFCGRSCDAEHLDVVYGDFLQDDNRIQPWFPVGVDVKM